MTVGDHATCVGPSASGPDDLASLTRMSSQPRSIDSCLEWFAVDLFTDAEGRVVAVTLDLYEP